MDLLYLFNDSKPRATMRLVLADDARISATSLSSAMMRRVHE